MYTLNKGKMSERIKVEINEKLEAIANEVNSSYCDNSYIEQKKRRYRLSY